MHVTFLFNEFFCLCIYSLQNLFTFYVNMTGVKVIILLSGKRKSGKDYVAALLHTE